MLFIPKCFAVSKQQVSYEYIFLLGFEFTHTPAPMDSLPWNWFALNWKRCPASLSIHPPVPSSQHENLKFQLISSRKFAHIYYLSDGAYVYFVYAVLCAIHALCVCAQAQFFIFRILFHKHFHACFWKISIENENTKGEWVKEL